ncbi:MAG: DTW domain-containing protein [Opitutae bacterium]|nr:DTW domain-containing protein [Opitutae bacterium]
MARSVVLNNTPRCPRCQLPPRWCICAAQRDLAGPLGVTVLQHFMESYRPSSTGHLIKRVLPAATLHLYRRERSLARADLAPDDRELWVLHPNGESMPAHADVSRVQVALIDGNWVQATEMARAAAAWGRRVSLPMTGESRYWLRAQSGVGRFSTMEALLFLLQALGLAETHAQLRLQFELHVFASLCARGQKQQAQKYVADSPVREAFPDLIAKLTHSRRD